MQTVHTQIRVYKQCIPRSDCSSGFTLFAFPLTILKNRYIKSKWGENNMEWSVPIRAYIILLLLLFLLLLVRRDIDQWPYTCWCLSTFYNSRLLWNHEWFLQFQLCYFYDLIFATLWVNSANDKSVIYFLLLLFPENKIWRCVQTVPGESLREISNLIFSKGVLQSCPLWKLIPFLYYWIMIPGS